MKEIKDLRITIKLMAVAILAIIPIIVAMVMNDYTMLRTWAYTCILTTALFWNEKGFKGYLKMWIQFHFLGKHKDGLSVGMYRILKSRIKSLRKWNTAYYEQKLIEEILDFNGATKIKAKLTGKHHNKLRIKGSTKFEKDRNRNKHYSNFKRKNRVPQ